MGRGQDSYIRADVYAKLRVIKYCFYCQSHCANPHIEHIQALSNGGTSDEPNLTVACGRCNSLKGTFNVSEFCERVRVKRDKLIDKTYSYTGRLRRYRRRGTVDESHKLWLIASIKANRIDCNYFTRIINSIENKKYALYYLDTEVVYG